MEEGGVPAIWRLVNVCPIFKKGAKGDPANYRPVSLTCVVGKVMESILRDRIVEHLERNSLIRPSQHGFMAGRSTATNLLVYMEALTKLMDESHAVDVLYLDFAKAFDKVPHRRLLEKCRGLGLDGKVLEWVRVWLEGRKQRVVLNGEASEWADVLSGVPQGSVLGPTLFLIFINDIDRAMDVTSSVLLKFADDTKVARVVESQEQQAELQKTIDRLVEWSGEWQMLFNSDKCHILHLGAPGVIISSSCHCNQCSALLLTPGPSHSHLHQDCLASWCLPQKSRASLLSLSDIGDTGFKASSTTSFISCSTCKSSRPGPYLTQTIGID